MTNTIEDVTTALATYCSEFRNPKREPLVLSGLYDLYPPQEEGQRQGGRWPDKWPYSDEPGVYLIFNERVEVLYVGKASMGNVLGNRLATYFQYEPGTKRCRVVHQWAEEDGQPRFVATIPVPRDAPFEAAALEEFLISVLLPPANRRGPCRK